MQYLKYVYKLTPEEFYKFLADYQKGVEVLQEGESFIEFAVYEPLQNFKPVDVLKVDVLPPEKAYRPVRIKNLMVVPDWIKPVVIRQGVAFGTGLHPTTKLCLYMLQRFMKGGWSVLDVGTGTGILAIASKRLGAGRVVAIDTDPQAVEECKHNCKENCVEVECINMSPENVAESFDLLVANLELEIFKRLMPVLTGLYKRVAIFSGLYGEEELNQFLTLTPHEPVKIKKLENWYSVVIRA
ncbi:MAG: 50S ribosomal protein L11 methyltransferase [Aquificaceae bacterium]|nr:50S ribosomal protein L11 methyltransferase [Aquificaceae bacterium]